MKVKRRNFEKENEMNAIRNAGCIFLFTLILGAAFYLNAQQTPSAQPSHPPADRCAAPEYKQLDFILGNWEVTNKGKKSADVTFEPTSNSSCGVMESWKNANGGGGRLPIDKKEARRLYREGLTCRQVAEKLGCHHSIVARCLRPSDKRARGHQPGQVSTHRAPESFLDPNA